MRIKGKNQHVMPNDTGWCVIDEASQTVVQHFNTKEEALEYAQKNAQHGEGEVLVHDSPCADTQNMSTVALPQREYFPGQGYVDVSEAASSQKPAQESADRKPVEQKAGNVSNSASDEATDTGYDPLLGYEDYYYDL